MITGLPPRPRIQSCIRRLPIDFHPLMSHRSSSRSTPHNDIGRMVNASFTLSVYSGSNSFTPVSATALAPIYTCPYPVPYLNSTSGASLCRRYKDSLSETSILLHFRLRVEPQLTFSHLHIWIGDKILEWVGICKADTELET